MSGRTLDGFLCCLVGADQYALRGVDVALVTRADEMQAGAADDGRVGVLARSGEQIPVYSLAALLGGRRDVRIADRHVVVTGAAGSRYGLLVDRLVRSGGNGASVIPLPSVVGGAAVRWFEGLLSLQETSCLVLAPEGLRPGGHAPAGGAAAADAPRLRPAAEVSSLVLMFASAALPSAAVKRHAVSAARVAAVVQSMPLVAVPGRGRHVAALGAWRGCAVAVLDFSCGAAVTAASRRFLVLRCGQAQIAIAVDPDTTLRRARPDDVRAAANVPAGYVRGVFKIGGEDVALVDVDRLVAAALDVARDSVPALV